MPCWGDDRRDETLVSVLKLWAWLVLRVLGYPVSWATMKDMELSWEGVNRRKNKTQEG